MCLFLHVVCIYDSACIHFNCLLCYTMMFYCVIIVVCSRASCETAFSWWVILGEYVLTKKWKKRELWCGQAHNEVNLYLKLNSIWPRKSRSIAPQILTEVFYISDPNFVIRALTGEELSCICWHTDWSTDVLTHRQTQATVIPGGRNWPLVKLIIRCIIPWDMGPVAEKIMVKIQTEKLRIFQFFNWKLKLPFLPLFFGQPV